MYFIYLIGKIYIIFVDFRCQLQEKLEITNNSVVASWLSKSIRIYNRANLLGRRLSRKLCQNVSFFRLKSCQINFYTHSIPIIERNSNDCVK